jgi:hypothetical protein
MKNEVKQPLAAGIAGTAVALVVKEQHSVTAGTHYPL